MMTAIAAVRHKLKVDAMHENDENWQKFTTLAIIIALFFILMLSDRQVGMPHDGRCCNAIERIP
ncbi:MAG: hypothetical protein NTZ22_06165 [Hyphomicrobiales bacterium]|nr:hypothetical protein [Hyphomicrobiales bacterium]